MNNNLTAEPSKDLINWIAEDCGNNSERIAAMATRYGVATGNGWYCDAVAIGREMIKQGWVKGVCACAAASR